MYIEKPTLYYRGNDQAVRRASFLILMQSKDRKIGPENMRGIIRKVAMRQFGHWMMGSAQIGQERITLSGSYGDNGLPVTVSEEVFAKGVPLPVGLYNAWNHGRGWNCAGNEALEMQKWAQTIS